MLLLQVQIITKVSYRYFRSIFVTLLFCTACVYAGTATAAKAHEPLYTVLNPTGFPPPIKRHPLAPRTGSLAGRPVYLVDVRFDNGDVFLKEMQKWFARNMPQVKTVFREKKGDYFTNDPKLWAEIKAKHGVMIMAIGH